MNEWSSYGNSYLRHLELLNTPEDSLSICTLSVAELQSALEQIQKFVRHMNTTKGNPKVECRIKISLPENDSKGMST